MKKRQLHETPDIGSEYSGLKQQLGQMIQAVNGILQRYEQQHAQITQELEGRLQGMGQGYAAGRKAIVKSRLQAKQIGDMDTQLKAMIEEKRHLITRYEKRIKKVEETVGEMQGQLDAMSQKGATDMEAVERLTQQTQRLTVELEEAKRDLSAKRDLLADKEKEMLALRQQIADAEGDRDQFGELLMIYEKRGEEYEKIIRDLEKKHDALRDKYMQMRDLFKGVTRYTRQEPPAGEPAPALAGAEESSAYKGYGAFNLTEHLNRGYLIEQRLKKLGR